MESGAADVHVMPNDDRHEASTSCWCQPKQDESNKRDVAQGAAIARVWVHNKAN